MTVPTLLTLLLLALTAASPLLLPLLGRRLADPVLPTAAVAAALLAGAAVAAAGAGGDPAGGWELAAAQVLGVLAATSAGSPVVRAVFRLVRREFLPRRVLPGEPDPARPPGPSPEPSAGASPGPAPETVLRGGAWIGYLERAAVAATLLAGWPEGIALALGVKGVGRYAELRQNNAPEAFIIGTFASLLWAAAAAGPVHALR